jgi:hypothetical protein
MGEMQGAKDGFLRKKKGFGGNLLADMGPDV